MAESDVPSPPRSEAIDTEWPEVEERPFWPRWALSPDLIDLVERHNRALVKRRAKRATKKAYQARRVEQMDALRRAAAIPKRLTGPSEATRAPTRTTVRGARPPIPQGRFS
jgi:hypothetical protein